MWERDIHIVVCHARLRIRTMRRGQSWCRYTFPRAQCPWTCSRAWLLPWTVVARSYRRRSLGCGIHGTCRKKLSAELYHRFSKSRPNLCVALALGWMASCRGSSVSSNSWFCPALALFRIVTKAKPHFIVWHYLSLSDDWWRVRWEAAGFVYSEILTNEVRGIAGRDTDLKNLTLSMQPDGSYSVAQHIRGTMQVFINPMVSTNG